MYWLNLVFYKIYILHVMYIFLYVITNTNISMVSVKVEIPASNNVSDKLEFICFLNFLLLKIPLLCILLLTVRYLSV